MIFQNTKSIEKTDQLFKHFEKYIKLSKDLKHKLAHRIELKVFKKGELLNQANKFFEKVILFRKA